MKQSRTMKSIQYIFENNVIRIWNEDILSADFSDDNIALGLNQEVERIDKKITGYYSNFGYCKKAPDML